MDPERIGKYRILRRLGQGAMGDVYLGEDPYIERAVAIKVLRQSDIESQQRFQHEARIVGGFSHPNIVLLLEFGYEGLEPFLAMEYLPGESLDVWMRAPHTLAERLPILHGLAEALEYAHAHGVLHRDVKPGNVQVLPTGACKLMDFGIARAPAGRLTATGTVMGTPNYMAPEILSDAVYSERSDIYSAGVLGYELLAGSNPFAAQTIAACLNNVLNLEPRPLSELKPELPRALGEAVMACLRKRPEERPASFQPLLDVLAALEQGRRTGAVVPAETSLLASATRVSRAPTPQVRRFMQIGLGAALAVVLALGSRWLLRSERADPSHSAPESSAADLGGSGSPVAPPQPASAPPPRMPLAAAPSATPTGVTRRPLPSPSHRNDEPPALAFRAEARPSPSAVPATPSSARPSEPVPTAQPTARAVTQLPPAATSEAEAAVAIEAVHPGFVRRGAAMRVELSGRGFRPGLQLVVLHGGRPAQGFALNGLRVHDGNRLSVNLQVDADVALDVYTLALNDGRQNLGNTIAIEVGL